MNIPMEQYSYGTNFTRPTANIHLPLHVRCYNSYHPSNLYSITGLITVLTQTDLFITFIYFKINIFTRSTKLTNNPLIFK